VTYRPYRQTLGVDNATHLIALDRLNAGNKDVTLISVDCLAPGWQMWALDTPYFSPTKPAIEDRIPVTDPIVIVDALVHCIDVKSRREAVHNPDADHEFEQKDKDYRALQVAGKLSGMATIDWQWTVAERKRRYMTRKRLRAIDSGEDDLEAMVCQVVE
jgi:hypothetical protein